MITKNKKKELKKPFIKPLIQKIEINNGNIPTTSEGSKSGPPS